MNNAIIVTLELGSAKIRVSIDERHGADYDNPMPKNISPDSELHFHTSYELFFSLGGELVIKDGDGLHSYTDSIVSVPPFTEHTVIKDPSRFRILFNLEKTKRRDGENIYSKLQDLLSDGITPLSQSTVIKFTVGEIKRIIKESGPLLREELGTLLKLLFLNIYKTNTAAHNTLGIGMENYLIVIDECINSHLCEGVDIAFVAERLHLSYRQTARIIKANYKEPLHEIINKKRLEKAKKLLSSTERSISDIALSVGFASESYFYRLFNKAYGVTPKKYRLQVLKNCQKNN